MSSLLPPEPRGTATLDPERIRRIQWRVRRGLLENDIMLGRYLAVRQGVIEEREAWALDQLLDLTDPALLDLLLERTEPEGELASAPVRDLLGVLRAL